MHFDYHLAIVERGAYAIFDGMGSMTWLGAAPDMHAIETRSVNHIVRLVRSGHVERILLSHDIARKSQLRAYGGNGYGYLLRTFVPRPREAGLTSAEIDTIIREKSRRLLSLPV